mgnify:FL=1
MLVDRPDWLSPAAERSINQKAFSSARFSIFDPDLTSKIHQAYENDPWVLRVDRVSKHFPNEVQVKLSLRRPIARVFRANREFLIDRDSMMLERLNRNTAATYRRLPAIIGAPASPPKRGVRWKDSGIIAAADIIRTLEREKLLQPLKIRVVDISNFGGRRNPRQSDVVLVRSNRVRILWGRTAGSFGELPLQQKLKKIRQLMKEAGDLGNVDWNIRFPNGGIITEQENLEGSDLLEETE